MTATPELRSLHAMACIGFERDENLQFILIKAVKSSAGKGSGWICRVRQQSHQRTVAPSLSQR
jgi:hypothetical protein